MGKKDDLDPMGAVRNIADLVNEAISSGDYSSLNRQITAIRLRAARLIVPNPAAVSSRRRKKPGIRMV